MKPSTGDAVLYHPGEAEYAASAFRVYDRAPLAATVAYVQEAGVNLVVVDHLGNAHALLCVPFVGAGETSLLAGHAYCTTAPEVTA